MPFVNTVAKRGIQMLFALQIQIVPITVPAQGIQIKVRGRGGGEKGDGKGISSHRVPINSRDPKGGEVHRPLEFRKAGVVEGIGEPALAMHPPG